ncbi:hypothetical protein GCM10020358_71340 [Amorphoplanes nipponensis]|uniref:Tetratricopeptide repeat-containing protein n=1 Tax=Actinoplanes nipponensis TaxID=135950 RepID=A0A919JC33_9ACTN|nr:hypothetical protein [Actinoplanes nipponensis]GIE47078.1 hypothetical protein Ani05nite_06120 [Actinoplanes nipponensis]
MAAPLDIVNDDPDEYPGRLVVVDGVEYVIGELVGEGGERFVHALTSRRTGLQLHLINILKDQVHGAEAAARTARSLGELRDRGVPVVNEARIVRGHGGVFEVQEAMAPGRGRADDEAQEAEQALRAGDLDRCAAACERVIRRRDDHSYVWHLLAQARLGQNRASEALDAAQRAIDIEPNSRIFRWSMLQALAALGVLHAFMDLFEDLRRKWPTDNRLNPLAFDVLLALGRPADAMALPLMQRDTALRARAEPAVRNWRRAQEHLARAGKAFFTGTPDAATADLREAYASYPDDPQVAGNWALARLREGDWAGCIETLMPAVARMPPMMWDQCLATIAFATAEGRDDQRAAGLLVSVVEQLEQHGPLVFADLPLWAEWFAGDRVVGERSGRAARAVAGLIDRLAGPTEAPAELHRLLAAYRAGPPEFRDDHS